MGIWEKLGLKKPETIDDMIARARREKESLEKERKQAYDELNEASNPLGYPTSMFGETNPELLRGKLNRLDKKLQDVVNKLALLEEKRRHEEEKASQR